ncbi:MAG: DivIVA domain-containing protein [Solirubrobacteraceae bacterium]
MSYNDESDPRRARTERGADPTEAFQATAEWDAVQEDGSWQEEAGDGRWEEAERPVWEQQDDQDSWDPSAQEDWDEQPPEDAPGGVTAAKQSISGAADRITRWFAGLDRRPEYEDQVRGADPVAELTPAPAPSERARGAARERGASTGRLAAASRAAAANRRRSVAASREGASGAGVFSRGSGHALRGDRDRGPLTPPPLEDQVDEPLPELMGGAGSARFPVAPLGYNRQAVDEQFADLESELTQLRQALAQQSHGEPPMSIQEELERIGEETASILVVAHDKAHETTRIAQEQAERCIADAAANAVAITDEAKRKLAELEAETDGVSRRRERLIADVRNISGSLESLADDAERRFAELPAPTEPEVEPQTEVWTEGEPAMYGPAAE